MHGWVTVYVICPYLSSAEPTQSFSIFLGSGNIRAQQKYLHPNWKALRCSKGSYLQATNSRISHGLRSSDNLLRSFQCWTYAIQRHLGVVIVRNRSTAYLNPPIFCWTEKSKGRGSLQTWPNPCLHFAIRQNWHTCHCSAHVNLWEIAAPSLLDDAALHP